MIESNESVNGWRKRRIVIGVIVVLAIAVTVLVAYTLATMGPVAAAIKCTRSDYLDALGDIPAEWDDAVELAYSTPRIQLSGRIMDLQSIKRAADRLDVPSCGVEANEALVKQMESRIAGFVAFMSEEPDATVQRLMNDADDLLDDWKLAVLAIGPD